MDFVRDSSYDRGLLKRFVPSNSLAFKSNPGRAPATPSRPDSESGLYYRARYYDPAVGRFPSEDPLRFDGGVNFRRTNASPSLGFRAQRQGYYPSPLYGSFLSNPTPSRSGARHLYRYAGSNPVAGLDPLGLWTVSSGLTISGQFGAFNWQISLGLAIDSCGHIGTYSTEGAGIGVGAKASAGGSVAVSPGGTCICDLQGPFDYASAGLGEGVGASLDTAAGFGSNGQTVHIIGVTGGASFGVGGSAGMNTTQIHPLGGPSCDGC